MANIVWMQTGACSGDSMALLCADRPSIENLVEHYGLNFLWHPSLTAEHRFGDVLDALLSGREKLDILCIEGSLMTGPNGSGQYDTWKGRAKIDIVRQLAPWPATSSPWAPAPRSAACMPPGRTPPIAPACNT